MSRTEIELIRDGKVVRTDLEDSIIDTSKLDTDAITTVKIADGQVTPAKLSASVSNTFFPIGGIILWSGATSNIPADFRLCDGNNGTPDLRGRFIVGASAGGGYNVNETGGSNTVTLTEAQLPTHAHSDGTYGTNSDSHEHSDGSLAISQDNHQHSAGTYESSDNTHAHSVNDPGHHHEIEFSNSDSGDEFIEESGRGKSGQEPTLGNQTGISINNNTHSHDVAGVSGFYAHTHQVTGSTAADVHSHDVTGQSGSTGSNQAHENRPPYYALAYIMKVS